jgi:toxin YoeB
MRLEFDPLALEDLCFWMDTDRRMALKIITRIEDIPKTPFIGLGKSEPLRFELKACWSRRIDHEHRLSLPHRKEHGGDFGM